MACCSGIAKIMLVIVNFCVWVVGIALIAVGSWVIANSAQYSAWFEDEDTITIVAGFTIGIGCVVFFVGFCGCYGAISKTVCFLQIYFGLLAMIIILEVIAGILAFVYQDAIIEGITDSVVRAVDNYNGTAKSTNTSRPMDEALDKLQEDFKCCGAHGVGDWANASWGQNEQNKDKASPDSCCKEEYRQGDTSSCNVGSPGEARDPEKMNIKGCAGKDGEFIKWLEGNYLIIGAVCLGLLAFEILAMVFACCLIKEKEDK